MKLPDFKKEKSLARKGYKIVVGIDEAGRGPLAGPVVAAVLALPQNSEFRIKNSELKLKDSKKLSPQKREKWYRILTRHPRIKWAAASVGPKTIDKINVARAANLAAERALRKLKLKPARNIFILLDGSLSSPREFRQETIIKGDEKIWSIAAASIIAKVTRDRKMRRLSKKFPDYGFDIHKGYGTKLHYQKLRKFGSSTIHRKTFLRPPVTRPGP